MSILRSTVLLIIVSDILSMPVEILREPDEFVILRLHFHHFYSLFNDSAPVFFICFVCLHMAFEVRSIQFRFICVAGSHIVPKTDLPKFLWASKKKNSLNQHKEETLNKTRSLQDDTE